MLGDGMQTGDNILPQARKEAGPVNAHEVLAMTAADTSSDDSTDSAS